MYTFFLSSEHLAVPVVFESRRIIMQSAANNAEDNHHRGRRFSAFPWLFQPYSVFVFLIFNCHALHPHKTLAPSAYGITLEVANTFFSTSCCCCCCCFELTKRCIEKARTSSSAGANADSSSRHCWSTLGWVKVTAARCADVV